MIDKWRLPREVEDVLEPLKPLGRDLVPVAAHGAVAGDHIGPVSPFKMIAMSIFIATKARVYGDFALLCCCGAAQQPAVTSCPNPPLLHHHSLRAIPIFGFLPLGQRMAVWRKGRSRARQRMQRCAHLADTSAVHCLRWWTGDADGDARGMASVVKAPRTFHLPDPSYEPGTCPANLDSCNA